MLADTKVFGETRGSCARRVDRHGGDLRTRRYRNSPIDECDRAAEGCRSNYASSQRDGFALLCRVRAVSADGNRRRVISHESGQCELVAGAQSARRKRKSARDQLAIGLLADNKRAQPIRRLVEFPRSAIA